MRNFLLLTATAFIIFACTEDNTINDLVEKEPRITRDERGEVSMYKLGDFGTGYATDTEFFQYVLEMEETDSFELIDNGILPTGAVYARYVQYYKDIPVWNGQYTIYKMGEYIYQAEGKYIRVGQINTTAGIANGTATGYWCKYLNVPQPDQSEIRTKLVIVQPEDNISLAPALAYRVYLRNATKTNTLMGFVNADNGSVLMTEPLFIF